MFNVFKFKTVKDFIQTFDDGVHQPHIIIFPESVGDALVQCGHPVGQPIVLKLITSATRVGICFDEENRTIEVGLRFNGRPIELVISTDDVLGLFEPTDHSHISFPDAFAKNQLPPDEHTQEKRPTLKVVK